MKNKTQILEIPKKDTFSGNDYDNWKLCSVDFYPFADLDGYAEVINAIRDLLVYSSLPKDRRELVEEAMTKAKSFACSTIILNNRGHCQRVFFESPKDLENFLINYKE